jgi:hypothetical protein
MPQANTSLEQLVDVLPITTSYTTAAAISAAIAQDAAEDPNVVAVAGALGTITTVATNIANVNTVAGVSANVTTVAGISANVTTVAGAAANISTVATNVANVNTVAGISANVTSVATNSANINTVAAANTNITTVATNIANVNTVAGANAAVTTVATNIANVNTVVTNVASVNTVAGNVANVNTVAGISANVTSVASNSANINTVATNIASVNTVATNVAATTTVATNIANVNTVSTNIADVGLVADDIADVNLVADDIESVTTVAGKMSDVTAVATNSANINTVAAANANITTVATNIANVNTVAGISANVTTVAGISAAVVAAPTHAATATTQAGIATTQANIATTQAGLATTARVGSEAARDAAIAIVYGGTYSINAAAGNVPIADTDARLGNDWLHIGTDPNEIPLNQFLGGMAYQDPNNVTIGGGSATLTSMTATTVTGTSMVYNGAELNSRLNPLAQAISVQMTAAASGSNGIQQLTNVQNNFGTGNFALQWRGSVPDWTPAATLVLIWKFSTVGYVLSVRSSGLVRIQINGTVYESTVATGLADNAVAVLDIDVTRESPTVAGSVVFTLNGVQLGASVAITAGVPATVDNSGSLYVCGDASARTAAQWFSHRLFNRAKTVAENLGMFVNGVSSVDVGGSNTNFFTGDSVNFEGGTVGSWGVNTGNGATSVAVNSVSPISGTYDLKITSNGLANSGGYITIGAVVAGEKYRLVFDYKGATSNAWSIIFRNNANPSSGSVWTSTQVGGTDWQPATAGKLVYEFTAAITASSARIHITNSAVDSIQIDNCLFINLGMTSELLAQNAQTDNGQVLDSSGNKQHALLPAAGASIMGAISARRTEVRWTNTWAATSELQYVGGVNQAIFPINQYIDSLIVIPEGATLTGFTIGNGSNASYYATVSGTITSGVAIYVQLDRRVTDGTNLKLTITPMGAFTGNINTTLVGTELERR